MKDLLSSAIISLVLLPALSLADAQAQRTPSETAQKLYALVVKERLSGLPDERVMRLVRPYLSRELWALFTRARKEQRDFLQHHPDEKPPWVDGCLFSCAFEGPTSFRVGQQSFARRFAYVPVMQDGGEAGSEVAWVDTVVLVKESGRWVVWDVRMGCDWPFRMGPTLRAMLKDG
jgi:hypothetical protein